MDEELTKLIAISILIFTLIATYIQFVVLDPHDASRWWCGLNKIHLLYPLFLMSAFLALLGLSYVIFFILLISDDDLEFLMLVATLSCSVLWAPLVNLSFEMKGFRFVVVLSLLGTSVFSIILFFLSLEGNDIIFIASSLFFSLHVTIMDLLIWTYLFLNDK